MEINKTSSWTIKYLIFHLPKDVIDVYLYIKCSLQQYSIEVFVDLNSINILLHFANFEHHHLAALQKIDFQ